jgi:hypothetical protein
VPSWRIFIEGTSLIIREVTPDDEGAYTCTISTACGSVVSSPIYFTLRACACSRADIAGSGRAGLYPDGVVDGSDFITFINSFVIGQASIDPHADIAGSSTDEMWPDGVIDGTDFIVFINAFAAGC